MRHQTEANCRTNNTVRCRHGQPEVSRNQDPNSASQQRRQHAAYQHILVVLINLYIQNSFAHRVCHFETDQNCAGNFENCRQNASLIESQHAGADGSAKRIRNVVCSHRKCQHEGNDEAQNHHPQNFTRIRIHCWRLLLTVCHNLMPNSAKACLLYA